MNPLCSCDISLKSVSDEQPDTNANSRTTANICFAPRLGERSVWPLVDDTECYLQICVRAATDPGVKFAGLHDQRIVPPEEGEIVGV